MEEANARAVRANGAVLQVNGAAVADGEIPLVNDAVLDGARVRVAVQAAAPVVVAPVSGPLVAPVAGPRVAPVQGPLFPQGLVPARIDMDGFLLGPLPRKSNGSCKILPKIADETWP